MARLEKYSTGIVGEIKHNIREFKDGICPTNENINPEKISDNSYIIRRGETAAEIEKYRKEVMKEVFHYKRKNIVYCNEIVCTLPKDCTPEQEELFFQESYNYICSTLPMGERCIFLAEIHRDEGKILKDGVTVVQGQAHMHVMYIPAVPDTKHSGYDFRLCSDELTRRSIMLQWHKKYQAWMDAAGVNATVASGVTSGKGISVKSLKEITKQTGLSLDQIKGLEKENQKLQEQLQQKEKIISVSNQAITRQDAVISELRSSAEISKSEIANLQSKLHMKDAEISKEKNSTIASDREKAALQEQLREKELENQKIKAAAQQIISEKDKQLEAATAKVQELEQSNSRLQTELQKEKSHVQELQQEKEQTAASVEWGNTQGWGTTTKSFEEEKVW